MDFNTKQKVKFNYWPFIGGFFLGWYPNLFGVSIDDWRWWLLVLVVPIIFTLSNEFDRKNN